MKRVVIATRGSALARWQSNWVAGELRRHHPGLTVDLKVVKTTGDVNLEQSLQDLGGKGAFTKEVQDALLDRSADVAVHSLKDLPTLPIPGLRVWANPARFDPRDAWFGRDGRKFSELVPGDHVATGSLRRSAQILHAAPGVVIEPLRGNVDTRLRKFAEGSMTGMLLAKAGLERLGLMDPVTEVLDPEVILPAPGQGALAIEGRDEEATRDLLNPLNDPDTQDTVCAERSFLATLEAGCQVPLGAWARLENDDIVLDGLIAGLSGTPLLKAQTRGPRSEAAVLGERLAKELLERGGGELLREAAEH